MLGLLDFANRGEFCEFNNIKKMFNQDLPDVLWSLILQNKIKLFNVHDKQIIADSLETYRFYPDAIERHYNYNGDVDDSTIIKRTFLPSYITSINIFQHFYFDIKRNLLFSIIPFAKIYSKNITDYTTNKREVCLGKVVFSN